MARTTLLPVSRKYKSILSTGEREVEREAERRLWKNVGQ